jgi:hypothetical protein
MDYLVIGSAGFAQVGQPDYYEKMKIEMKVLLDHIRGTFPIPEFPFHCGMAVKSFPHDFGTYHEIVLHYDNVHMDKLSESTEEKDAEILISFWNYFNELECQELDSEFLIQKMKEMLFDKRMKEAILDNSIVLTE